MMPFTIKGIGVVNATPLHPDDTLNEEEYRRHIRRLAETIRLTRPARDRVLAEIGLTPVLA